MGTSQSSIGPGSRSPLIPPWADDQPNQLQTTPELGRFKGFRQSLGKFVAETNVKDLKKAIGHYARKASGGGASAARRMSRVTQAGAGLYGVLAGLPATSGEVIIDLSNLEGLQCELAISVITEALATADGDSDTIRTAMNHALVEALDGVEVFNPDHITDDVIVDTMIGYLSESIFLQMVLDSNKAWNKAETPAQAIRAETDLRELIKVVVDKYMAPKLKQNVRKFTRQELAQLERQAILDAWLEWEAYE